SLLDFACIEVMGGLREAMHTHFSADGQEGGTPYAASASAGRRAARGRTRGEPPGAGGRSGGSPRHLERDRRRHLPWRGGAAGGDRADRPSLGQDRSHAQISVTPLFHCACIEGLLLPLHTECVAAGAPSVLTVPTPSGIEQLRGFVQRGRIYAPRLTRY